MSIHSHSHSNAAPASLLDNIIGHRARIYIGNFTTRFFHKRAQESDWGQIPVELLKKIFEGCPTSVRSIRQVNRHWRNCSCVFVKSLQLDFLSQKIEIFPNVTYLNLSEVSVQPCNQDLALLRHLPRLQALSLFACRLIDGRGLLHLHCLDQLKTLDLREWHQTDNDLAPISCLGSLECLQLNGSSGLTDQALIHISNLRNLKQLDLSQCDNIALHAPTASCLSNLTNLTALHLNRVSRVNNLSAEVIGSLSSLVTLKISHNNIGDQGALQLTRLTQLRILKANHTYLRDQSVQHLKNLPKLQRIHLRQCGLTDLSLRVLAEMPDLIALHVENNQFSNQGVLSLKTLKNLNELNITHTPNLSYTVFETLTGLTSLSISPSYSLCLDPALNNVSIRSFCQNGLEQNPYAQQRLIKNLPFLQRLNGLHILPKGPRVETVDDAADMRVKNVVADIIGESRSSLPTNAKSAQKRLGELRKSLSKKRESVHLISSFKPFKFLWDLISWIANSFKRMAQATIS